MSNHETGHGEQRLFTFLLFLFGDSTAERLVFISNRKSLVTMRGEFYAPQILHSSIVDRARKGSTQGRNIMLNRFKTKLDDNDDGHGHLVSHFRP